MRDVKNERTQAENESSLVYMYVVRKRVSVRGRRRWVEKGRGRRRTKRRRRGDEWSIRLTNAVKTKWRKCNIERPDSTHGTSTRRGRKRPSIRDVPS
jgi:hypothetical protein